MRSVLRAALVAPVLALPFAVASPASAHGVVEFTGPANINCIGCGVSTGTADLVFTGEVNGRIVVLGPGYASFTVNSPTGVMCMTTGSASGSITGAVNVCFNGTRVGNQVVLTVSGDPGPFGRATLFTTSPIGNWCGGAVTMSVEGWIGGF